MAIRQSIAAILLLLSLPAFAAPVSPATMRVIDGDTVAVGAVHYRLVGFDTPEKGPRARCPAERELANRAAARLRQIIAAGGADLEEVACSCRPGTQGTPACNYGRRCGTLTAAGRDVGAILIAEGLARPYPFDWRHRPPAANWCGARP
ncbi:thermonuclease family protein [Azorhizobium doebereinerae]|uniref:thermonuclease family protein n=1 Tax=Azorhizobium doebereinerae TaxID=281091 RepID=UPI0003FE12A7|nr:thermonuclease family protein [Azorhizobium doebereinerae]